MSYEKNVNFAQFFLFSGFEFILNQSWVPGSDRIFLCRPLIEESEIAVGEPCFRLFFA